MKNLKLLNHNPEDAVYSDQSLEHDLLAFLADLYGVFGEESQISSNQKRESTVFSILIGYKIWDPSPKIPYSRQYFVLVLPLIVSFIKNAVPFF